MAGATVIPPSPLQAASGQLCACARKRRVEVNATDIPQSFDNRSLRR